MADLTVLKKFSQLFEEVQTALNYYNENLNNDLFSVDENEYEYEKSKIHYKRGETIFDKVDENLNNLNLVIEKEREIVDFFEKC